MGTYSFLNVVGNIAGPGGVIPIGGEAGVAEEGVSIAYVEDKNTMTIGADGSGMHSLHAGRASVVTVRLLQTSPFNAVLSMMYNLQTTIPGLHGQNAITFQDVVRGDHIECNQVAFKKFPDVTYAKEGAFREWTFDAISTEPEFGSGIFNAGLSINLGFGIDVNLFGSLTL